MSQAFIVTPKESGRTLSAVLKSRLGLTWSQVRRMVEMRRVRLAGQGCADPVRRLRVGQRVEVMGEKATAPKQKNKKQSPQIRPPSRKDRNAAQISLDPVLRYIDDAIVVVDKPPGITTHRSAEEAAEFGARGKRFLPSTLEQRLPSLLPEGRSVRAVHRIDRDTSGLVVFARTAAAESDLGKQFRAHTVARRYLAVARGRPPEGTIESWLVRDRGDGRRGSIFSPRPVTGGKTMAAQRAITHVRVLENLGPCCLVECRLETGRTHQVRIHLGEAGAPLAGERVYDRPMNGSPIPDPSGAPRVALHAAYLGFRHPVSGLWMEWDSPLPDDLLAVVRRLRRASN